MNSSMRNIEMTSMLNADDEENGNGEGLSLHRAAPSGYQSFAEIHDYRMFIATGQKSEPPWMQILTDLDAFFERIYRYYQASGFFCIVLGHVLELVEIVFVTFTTFFLLHGVNYSVLFKNSPPTGQTTMPTKVTIGDCLIPLSDADLSLFEYLLLGFAIIFWITKACQAVYSILENYAIRAFYAEVLLIHDPSLYSWQEVQSRLVRNQSQYLIREGQLDELAVHNRLLRRSNYMIALINKGILPIYFKLPVLGETIYLTKGLELNFELLLFRGFLSLFEKNWKLHDDVKSPSARIESAHRFANRCLVLGFLNIFLLPFIFCWQLLYAFYTYVETFKRDPGFASSRTWSRYGRWYCKHINELEHELDQRLNRAHRPASRYMNQFTTPWLEVMARFFTFVAGTLLSVIIVLTVYDEDVITVEHILTLVTGLGTVIALSRAFMPDNEPNRWSFAELDAAIVQHIHYRPHGYPAHTIQARTGMTTIFVYRFTTIIEELLSPLVTPYILIRHLRPRALDIIDFFRMYTLELTDIGDVCSFSQFNYQQNGNRIINDIVGSNIEESVSQIPAQEESFQADENILPNSVKAPEVMPDQRYTTRNGKLELSLIHFKLMNPSWKPHDSNQSQFIEKFVKQSRVDSSVPPALIEHHLDSQQNVANSRSTIDLDIPGTSWLGHPALLGDVRQQSSQQFGRSQLRQSNMGGDSLHTHQQPHHQQQQPQLNETTVGFEQTRRKLLQQSRVTGSMMSEQEERDTDMALSSLFFHEIAANQSTSSAQEASGGGAVGAGSGSRMSESIPLLRRG